MLPINQGFGLEGVLSTVLADSAKDGRRGSPRGVVRAKKITTAASSDVAAKP
jgi:hypothetical protein